MGRVVLLVCYPSLGEPRFSIVPPPSWHPLNTDIHRPSDATEQLTRALSLQPLDGTDVALSTSTHTLKLYGKTLGGGKVAALVKMAFSARSGVTTKITVRAEEDGVAALVVGSVA